MFQFGRKANSTFRVLFREKPGAVRNRIEFAHQTAFSPERAFAGIEHDLESIAD